MNQFPNLFTHLNSEASSDASFLYYNQYLYLDYLQIVSLYKKTTHNESFNRSE